MRREVKAHLIINLEAGLDSYLLEQGFARGRSSLVYKRELRGATQKIDITVQVHPKDNPNAAAAVYPFMEVLVPTVDRVLADMVGDNFGLLEGVTGGTSKQPIEFTSSKVESARWYLYQPDSLPSAVEEMRTFIERWTVPFLDTYATAEDIVETDRRNDGRLPRDRAQMMRVVAAALVCHRREYAQALVEKYLGAPGARRRYQQVFDYIQQTNIAGTS